MSFWQVVLAILVAIFIWTFGPAILIIALGIVEALFRGAIELIGGIIGGILQIVWWPFGRLIAFIQRAFGAQRFDWKPIRHISVFRYRTLKAGDTFPCIHGPEDDLDYSMVELTETPSFPFWNIAVRVVSHDPSYRTHSHPRDIGHVMYVRPWHLFEFEQHP